MDKFLLLANWKANKTVEEAQTWLSEFMVHRSKLTVDAKLEIAVAAPYTLLHLLEAKIVLASQDISQYPAGAYTGEVSADQLRDLGVKYCLVGHSERRKYFGETNPMVEKKISQATKVGIIPIICAQNTEEIPDNIRNFNPEKYFLMYEPFSAISTDGQYHPESPEKVVAVLSEWQSRFGQDCRFLYGGSVSPNDQPLFQSLVTNDQSLLSGFVVGHASLAVETFFAIINKCLQSLFSI